MMAADTGNPADDTNDNVDRNTIEGIFQLYQNEFTSDGNMELVRRAIEYDTLIS
jgi:hypothetical protein|tara:strand:- start:308 stop:469 length:162 start_codon:yes stop_codon:yes gene_type:complete